MDLKYLLCEPVSKLAVKANEQTVIIQQQQQKQQQQYGLDWHSNTPIYPSVITKGQDWIMSSPKSTCSSISTCSSTSTNSDDYTASPPDRSNSFSSLRNSSSPKQQQQQQQNLSRRRTASDVSLTRHHMFIYSHPNRRPRSESAGNNNNVQTRTPWTPFEDHLLQQGYDQGLSWAMISSTYLPHRSRGCCWGRFKTLQNKNMVDPSHSHMRHFRRPWKAIDFNGSRKSSL
ncbi:hypothetical protein HPULCUR_003735 [Helicostylum pulchrum]|uniref:Myb-like domain-containing protein n=1 Tax=Helicostylum pulchrum TaxID=562976 RepID=A0ABP9XVC1_9FUNG